MLVSVTRGDMQELVEMSPGQGFDARRRLHERYHPIGETLHMAINSLMRQLQCKDVSNIPAAINKFEKDLCTLKDRMTMPILLLMIPTTDLREVEDQLRISGADRTCEVLSRQLCDQDSEARYKFKRSPNDMQFDTLATQPEQKSWDQY